MERDNTIIEPYKKTPYGHHHLHSKEIKSSRIIDKKIQELLDAINDDPKMTDEMLQSIQENIQAKLEEKIRLYLAPGSQTRKSRHDKHVQFGPNEKYGGKSRKSKKDHEYSKFIIFHNPKFQYPRDSYSHGKASLAPRDTTVRPESA